MTGRLGRRGVEALQHDVDQLGVVERQRLAERDETALELVGAGHVGHVRSPVAAVTSSSCCSRVSARDVSRLHRPECRAEHLRRLGLAESGDEPAPQHLPVGFRQALQRDGEQLVLQSALGCQVGTLGRPQVQARVAVVAADAANAAAHVVLGVVGDDPQHPRPHRAGAPVRREVAMHVDERILHDVLGLLGRTADHHRHPQRGVLMAPHELAEGGAVCVTSARQQRDVVELGSLRRMHGDRSLVPVRHRDRPDTFPRHSSPARPPTARSFRARECGCRGPRSPRRSVLRPGGDVVAARRDGCRRRARRQPRLDRAVEERDLVARPGGAGRGRGAPGGSARPRAGWRSSSRSS